MKDNWIFTIVLLVILIITNFPLGTSAQTIASFSRHDIPVTYKSQFLLVEDFNNDGVLDLVSANGNGGISLFLGNGDGTFQKEKITATNVNLKFLVAADFNGDKNMDLATNSKILLGNGKGNFTVKDVSMGSEELHSAAAGDINHDRIPDLMIGQNIPVNQKTTSNMLILLGNGDGTFQSEEIISIPNGIYLIPWYVYDINNDNNKDILMTYMKIGGGDLYWEYYVGYCLGDGKGSFGVPIPITSWYSEGTDPPVFKDFNHDGYMDIFISFRSLDHCFLLLGDGKGHFQKKWDSSEVYLSKVRRDIPFIIDVNNDSFLDIGVLTLMSISENSPNKLLFYLGMGNGTFGEKIADDKDALTGWYILTADINNDKRDDFFIARQDSYLISTFINEGIQTGIQHDTFHTSLLPSFNTIKNWPNPFNGKTIIKYLIDSNDEIVLSVYDIGGRKIKTLYDGFCKVGNYSVTWDGKDDLGKNVSSGIYISLLKNKKGGEIATSKMLLIK